MTDHKEITVNPKLYDGYVGRYNLGPVTMTVAHEGEHLFAQMSGRKIQLFPEGIRDYFFRSFDAQITFVTDGSGRATALMLREGGTDLYANRIE